MPANGRWDLTRRLKGYNVPGSQTAVYQGQHLSRELRVEKDLRVRVQLKCEGTR